MIATAIAALVRRNDAVVLAALAALLLFAWIALLGGAGTGMDPFAMSTWRVPAALPSGPSGVWTPADWLIVFIMWVVMMAAMMLPSASPLMLLYARVIRQAEGQRRDLRVRTTVAALASGYLAIWILFSLLAVCIQWGLERAGAMSAMMSLSAIRPSGAFLMVAGLYQLTPLKAACLKHCRGPAAFLAHHWRPGVAGAWRMGLAHGSFCLGCCGLLMLLLFVGGVMNLAWIAGLTLLVAIEKLAPFGTAMATATGAVLIAGGAALVIAGL